MSSGWVSVSTPYVVLRDANGAEPWAAEAADRGRTGTHQLREVAETLPSVEVARALGISNRDAVVVRRRLVLLDGEPVELADSYYPASLARGTGLAAPGKIRGGAVALLAQLGHVPRHIQEEVHARLATSAERNLLALADGEWVLILVRQVADQDGVPVEASVMTMVARGRSLRYELTI